MELTVQLESGALDTHVGLTICVSCSYRLYYVYLTVPASALAAKMGHLANLDIDEKRVVEAKMAEKEQGHTRVQEAEEEEDEASKFLFDISAIAFGC